MNKVFMQAMLMEDKMTKGQLTVTNPFPLEQSYAEAELMKEMMRRGL